MKKLLPAVALLLAASPLFSQISVTYQNPDSLYVCGQDTFTVFLKNTGGSPSAALPVDVSLDAGISYVAGSVSGANEQNISNLQKPSFLTNSIPAGQTRTIRIILSPDCSLVAAINGGQKFSIQVNVGGQPAVTTANFTVETGLAVILSVSPDTVDGMKGDQFTRKITVKNTRLGKISELHLTDLRDFDYIDVDVADGVTTASTGTLLTADFDGNFIKNFGDGDSLFEKDETVTFTETVTIRDCGYPPPAMPLPKICTSKIRVGWGCGGAVCTYDSTTAVAIIQKSTKVPNVIFGIKAEPPLDKCGKTPSTQRILFKNIGLDKTGSSFFVQFEPPTGGVLKGGFRDNSFRLVTAAGAVSPLAPLLQFPTPYPACNDTFFLKSTVTLPTLQPGDSLWVEVDLFSCDPGCTGILFQDLAVNIYYTKECPPGGFDSKNFGFTTPDPATAAAFAGGIETQIGTCMAEGGSYPFKFVVESSLLQTVDGTLHIVVEMPPGVSIDPSCALLVNGSTPVSVAQSGQTLTVQIDLPIADSAATMPFCLNYHCQPGLPCIDPNLPAGGGDISLPLPDPTDMNCAGQCDLKLKSLAAITKLPTDDPFCGLNSCGDITISVVDTCMGAMGGGGSTGNESPASSNPGTPGGGSPGSKFNPFFKAERINFGLADKNDDRKADLPLASAATAPNLRRDRFMTGDTIRETFFGAVAMGGGYTGFPIRFYHEIVDSDEPLNGADKYDLPGGRFEYATPDSGFVFLKGNLRVRYASGATASCPIAAPSRQEGAQHFTLAAVNVAPPITKDELVTSWHQFDLSLPALAASGCLPKPTLEAGDSIFIETDYKVMANFIDAPLPIKSNPPLINVRSAAALDTTRQYAWDFYPHVLMQYSGFKEALQPNTFGIRPCENSTEVKALRYRIFIARPNMFPFEVRPLSRITEYKQTYPPGKGLALQSAMVKYLVLQDSVPELANVSLPTTDKDSFYLFDFSPAFSMPHDEGFILGGKVTWLPDCNFPDPDSSKQFVQISYPHCFFEKDSFTRKLFNTLGFYANAPLLKATVAQPMATSQTGAFDFPVVLKNQRVSPAQNSWAYFTDSLGTTSGYEILINGVPLTASNGLFQIGSIGSFSEKNLQIRLNGKACGPEKLYMIYGWSCAPLAAPPMNMEACGQDTLTIDLQNLATELELDIAAQPPQIPLCAESDWFEFEVYNAKIGHAFDILASVKLPQGLTISPGSAQVSYPAGAAWQPVADPAALAGNLFLWKINDILPALAANGLPGVDEQPKNRIKIRFKVVAECGFVAESQPVFATEGREPCGAQTNLLRKTGDPIHLAGVSPGYSAQVSLSPASGQNLPLTCGQKVKLNAQIILSGQPLPGDSITVTLPPGASYVAGSYAAGAGGPVGPPVFFGQKGRLPLPTGQTAVNFSFEIRYDSPAGCLDAAVLLQVQSATTALCAATGQPCGVLVANGSALWFLPTANPELQLTSLVVVENSPGHWGIDATVSNPSSIDAPSPVLQLFNDIDGNGQAGAGDVLLGTFNLNAPLPAGQTGHVLGDLIGNPPFLCQLVAVIPAAENCLCSPAEVPISQNLTFEHLPLVFCLPVVSQKIGVDSLPGATYSWTSAAGQIGCATCAKTGFTFPPNWQPGASIELVLIEKQPGGCERKHIFPISFGASFDLTASDLTLCLGESTTLSAQSSAGGIFLWSGPGADGKATQTVSVKPVATAAYSVTVTLSSGCTGVETETITVFPADTTTLPKIVQCPGDVVIFGQTVSQPGIYSKKLQNAAGCDSTVFVELKFLPAPQTAESHSICLGDSIPVFGQMVGAAGVFSKKFPAANGCDSTHTVTVSLLPKPVFTAIDTIFGKPGDSLIIHAPGGFIDYEWNPAIAGCNGCPSPVFVPDTLGEYHFSVTVTDASGCTAVGEVVLRIFPPCDAALLKIPNAFTPDGDGVNDDFTPFVPEGAGGDLRLRVYDRWGELVYERRGADVSWDGKIDGQPAPMDVYVWVLDVSCPSGAAQRVGDVTLVR